MLQPVVPVLLRVLQDLPINPRLVQYQQTECVQRVRHVPRGHGEVLPVLPWPIQDVQPV